MHIALVSKECCYGDVTLLPGEYVVEDVNGAEMLGQGICRLGTPPAVVAERAMRLFGPVKDWNGKRILFVRPGGFGDLLFLTPLFAELKGRWPGCVVHVACFGYYRDALAGNGDVDSCVDYPVALPVWQGYDACVWLENCMEGAAAVEVDAAMEGAEAGVRVRARGLDEMAPARRMHVVDLLAARVGLELGRGGEEDGAGAGAGAGAGVGAGSYAAARRLRYCLAEGDAAAARERYPRFVERGRYPRSSRYRRRVGVQVAASSAVRTYPRGRVEELVREFLRRGWEVYLFGSPGQAPSDSGPGLVNLTQRVPAVSFRESVAILATCDVCVAPDSALCHVAGALGIPTVALYGPFPWQLRTAYAPSVHAISGQGSCAPCFHHSRPGQIFPAAAAGGGGAEGADGDGDVEGIGDGSGSGRGNGNGNGNLCAATGECGVLAGIEPRRIVAKAESLIVRQQKVAA